MFRDQFDIDYLQNFFLMQESKPLPIHLLKKLDLFIFQPLKKKEHGEYQTEHIRNYLPKHCQTISFPYLYNDAFWPFFKNGEEFINSEPIIKLIEQRASLIEIMTLFLKVKIDFHFKERFENSISILRAKEGECDIKAVDYILDHLAKERLFLTLNHPASGLLIHCTNQVLTKLDFPAIEKSEHPNEAQLPGCLPLSPYERSFYGLTYQENWTLHFNKKKQGNWRHAYLGRILEIYLKQTKRNFTCRFQGKLIRSICKFIE